MTNLNSANNWPAILDSRQALKKYFYPRKAPSGMGAQKEAWPVSKDWQLASDPTRLADAPVKKKNALPKRVERKIWAKPGMVELTKRAVQTEKAINHLEKLQAKKLQEKPEKVPGTLPGKPQRSKRALCKPKIPAPIPREPKTKAVHRWRKRAVRTEKTKVSALKFKKSEILETPKRSQRAPLWKPKSPKPPVTRTPIGQTVERWRTARRPPGRFVVVDAKTEPMLRRDTRGGADQPMTVQQSPRLRETGRLKKTYGVPLCSRPTKLMGMGYPYSRQMQMRQQQLYQQPEYHDQYRRLLQQQHRQQQQRQLEQQYAQSGSSMAPHPQVIQSQDQLPVNAPYAVPTKTQLKRLKPGKRLCGNFYYAG